MPLLNSFDAFLNPGPSFAQLGAANLLRAFERMGDEEEINLMKQARYGTLRSSEPLRAVL